MLVYIALVVLLVGVVFALDKPWVAFLGVGLLGTGLILSIIAGNAYHSGNFNSPLVDSKVYPQKGNIYSLKNATSFTIGRYTGSSSDKYSFYMKNEEGGFYLDSAPSDAIIFEQEGVPYVTWDKIEISTNFWTDPWPSTKAINRNFKLYVPPNTIIKEFEVK